MNKDHPAFPVPAVHDPITGAGLFEGTPGLTKREYFAAKAMQELIALSPLEGRGGDRDATARAACEYADALLKALEDGK